MSVEQQVYRIKAGYRANLEQNTLDSTDGRVYWNKKRISTSAIYQYHVYSYCRRMIKRRGIKRVLDVGCGPATKVRELLSSVCSRFVLIDQPTTQELVAEIMPDATFIAADLEEMKVQLDESFDLIICADVVEHLLNPNPCVDFIRNHLSENGSAVFSTPERDLLRGRDCMHCPKAEHVREWNSKEFTDYLQSREFDVIEHLWLPPERLTSLEYQLSRIFGRAIGRKRWSTCQTAICRIPSG